MLPATLLLVVTVVVLALALVIVKNTRRSSASEADRVPILALPAMLKSSSNFASTLKKYCPSGFGRVLLWPFVDFYIVFGPEHARTFHSSRSLLFASGYMRFIGSLQSKPVRHLGEGTVVKCFKRALTTQFLNEHLKSVQNIVRTWIEDLPAKGETDIFPQFYRLLLRVAVRLFVGEVDEAVLERLTVLMKAVDLEDIIAHQPLTFVFPLIGKTKREANYAEVQDIVRQLVQDRISSGSERKDFFSAAIEVAKEQSGTSDPLDPRCVAIIFGIVQASTFAATTNQYATTAWLLYILDKHPHLAKYVYADMLGVEVDKVPSDPDQLHAAFREMETQDLSLAQLENMPFVDAFVRETVRVFTQGLAPREAAKDVQFGDKLLPKGGLVFFPHYMVNCDENIYERPDTFDPTRFIDQSNHSNNIDKLTSEFKNVGFGSGLHPCIGARFAHLQVKVLLSELLPRLRFHFVEEAKLPELQVMGVLRPVTPLTFCFEKL